MNEAFRLLNQLNVPINIRNQLQELLQNHFGFHIEEKDTVRLDIMKIPLRHKVSTTDPAFVSVSNETIIVKQLFDTLIHYSHDEDRIKPHLAHTWEHNEEGTKWTFYLRKGVYFHDGTLLTAKDVKYTFERIGDFALQSPSHWQVSDIKSINIINDQTISFELIEANLLFLHYLSSINMSIVPYGWSSPKNKPIGTGPFKLREYNQERLVIERFPYYFKESALLDMIEFWYVPAHFNIHIKYDLPMLDSRNKEKESVAYSEGGTFYLSFNMRKQGVQQDISFRKALRTLINRDDMIEELKGERTVPADSFLTLHSGIVNDKKHSLKEVKDILNNSSYKGEGLKLFYLNTTKMIEDVHWIKKRAERIGLNLFLHPFSTKDYYQHNIEQEADLALIGEIFEEDIELSLVKLYKQENSFLRRLINAQHVKVIDYHFDHFLQEPNKEKRIKTILQIEKYIKEELLILFMYHVEKDIKYHPALKGIRLDSLGWLDFRRLWNKPNN